MKADSAITSPSVTRSFLIFPPGEVFCSPTMSGQKTSSEGGQPEIGCLPLVTATCLEALNLAAGCGCEEAWRFIEAFQSIVWLEESSQAMSSSATRERF